ncbi:hypothetical protein BCV70DRAFT_18535 [Testicularia cyperi]|uniref:Uncharacterized protein n=1 Tax=Testicularia cyperi TaxID=1882483 RepID=A0A317Y0B2_9BASI|nr:hypothetical protein BCV70DRAFT_18535 [Testicularia cyperi]
MRGPGDVNLLLAKHRVKRRRLQVVLRLMAQRYPWQPSRSLRPPPPQDRVAFRQGQSGDIYSQHKCKDVEERPSHAQANSLVSLLLSSLPRVLFLFLHLASSPHSSACETDRHSALPPSSLRPVVCCPRPTPMPPRSCSLSSGSNVHPHDCGVIPVWGVASQPEAGGVVTSSQFSGPSLGSSDRRCHKLASFSSSCRPLSPTLLSIRCPSAHGASPDYIVRSSLSHTFSLQQTFQQNTTSLDTTQIRLPAICDIYST